MFNRLILLLIFAFSFDFYADEFDGEKPIDIYGATKICGELLIRNCCKDYTIFRIWDIA